MSRRFVFMKKVLFIVNPISGGKSKRKILRLIEAFASGSGIETTIRQTEAAGHATLLAKESDADVVVAVGGDGTVSEVAQGIAGTDKALGIIPCGSGDGLALHLGISRRPERALRTLLDGLVQTIDYGLVDGRPFFCTTGVGLDAEVAWQFAASGKRGLWTYISLSWKIWQHFKPETYTIEVDGKTLTAPAVFVTVGNANQWGNQARITSLASLQDGLLNLTVVAPFKTIEIPVLATKLLDGRAHTSRRVQLATGRHIVIRRSQEGPAHFDGDPCRKGTEIVIDIVPAALKVVVPRNRKI